MEIKIVKQILEWNEDVSEEVKKTLAENNICLINVMGSPGAGKTSLITDIINRLRDTYRIGVIEGDIAGAIDTDKIDKMGIPVVQLQTDGACHIEAMSIQHMLSFFSLDELPQNSISARISASQSSVFPRVTIRLRNIRSCLRRAMRSL